MSDILHTLTHASNPQAKIWKSHDDVVFPTQSKYFAIETHHVKDIHELSSLLIKLESQTRTCLIRGKYVGDDEAKTIDPEYENGKVRRTRDLFKDQALHCIMIEVDKFVSVDYCTISEPDRAVREYIADELPECFHDVSYYWQLSSSAGKAGNENVLKAHIWFWLSKPFTSDELRAWASAISLASDHAVFNPVQIHFTSCPIFENGVTDPIKKRSGFEQGILSNEVNLVISDAILYDANEEGKATRQQVAMEAINSDPVAAFLRDSEYFKSVASDGKLHIVCPFKDGHSIESNKTSTVYFPANTGGHKTGNFKCHHQSCAERTNHDFVKKIGIPMHREFIARDQTGIARTLIEDHFTIEDGTTLRYYNGELHRYSNGRYVAMNPKAVRARVRKSLDDSYRLSKESKPSRFMPSMNDINGVIDAIVALAYEEHDCFPVWLGAHNKRDASQYVSMANGILDIAKGNLLPHTPLFFTPNALPYGFEPNAMPEQWLTFLGEIFEGDHESIDTLQEIFGYLLTPITSYQKMFMILGPSRSGKSTIGRVLDGLLGKENMCSPSLNDMGKNFGMMSLRNKLVAKFTDARLSNNNDSQKITEKLLAISGEDSMTFDVKFKEPWTGVLTARMLMIANEFPNLQDPSNAILYRIICLETRKSFRGKEDPTLSGRLLTELPAIFNWALAGRERLLKRGYFLQPAASTALLEDMRRTNNPISAFVEDCCAIIPDKEVEKDDLYYDYRNWCKDNGRHPKGKDMFFKDLYNVVPSLKPIKLNKNEFGKRPTAVRGICLNYNVGDHADDKDDI